MSCGGSFGSSVSVAKGCQRLLSAFHSYCWCFQIKCVIFQFLNANADRKEGEIEKAKEMSEMRTWHNLNCWPLCSAIPRFKGYLGSLKVSPPRHHWPLTIGHCPALSCMSGLLLLLLCESVPCNCQTELFGFWVHFYVYQRGRGGWTIARVSCHMPHATAAFLSLG